MRLVVSLAALMTGFLSASCVEDTFVTLSLPGGSSYIGFVRDGVPHGRGTQTFPDGRSYRGSFQRGRFSGTGVLEVPDVSVYVGEFRYGWKHGYGRYTRADGGRYEGTFREDQIHGAEGSSIDTWNDNERYGEGAQRTADGQAAHRFFKDGKYAGPILRLQTSQAKAYGIVVRGSVHRVGGTHGGVYVNAVVDNSTGKSFQFDVVEASWIPTEAEPLVQHTGLPSGERFDIQPGAIQSFRFTALGERVPRNLKRLKFRLVFGLDGETLLGFKAVFPKLEGVASESLRIRPWNRR